MKDFSTLDNTSGAFPDVLATNSSGPTLRDGTPVNANLVNDIWGAFQAILNTAGTTPSGSVDSSSASDLLDSIRKVSGAPGEVVLHASPSDVIDANILPLKGQVITIASYPDLVAATYVGDAYNSTWNHFIKTSDAGGTTPDIAGSYFVLPDCRGAFIRSLAGAQTGVDVGRDFLQTASGDDYRNHSGYAITESPGQHIHDVETADPDGYGLERETQYVMTADPGDITGSGGVTVFPVSRTMYKLSSTGQYDINTKIGENGATDYDNAYYAEVRPYHVAFQLGIRY